jgi:hypothetical protein
MNEESKRGETRLSTTNRISGFADPIVLSRHDESSDMNGPLAILQSALAALPDGRISEVVEQFADHFTFNDHALTLEFKDKHRLAEFFERSREIFPDSAFEVGSMFESGTPLLNGGFRRQKLRPSVPSATAFLFHCRA